MADDTPEGADDTPEMAMEDAERIESSDEASENEAQVELLVSGRAKRSTAGNRMSAMIGEIAADDELELLFAEDEEGVPDEEFWESGGEGASDNDLGDSSDEEDQGPAAGAEDLDGEKDIERQAREERKRKRKAQKAFVKPSKKLKRAPFPAASASAIPASKAKKKVERLSWIPAVGEGTRTSRRTTTTLQSEALRTRIVAREADREEQVKRLEEKARRRAANKPKALTQADRLREAAEVEKENAKSLNRWETIERERQEEQRARLEALQNRKLEGPVITYWSGPARWVGDRLTAVSREQIRRPESKHARKISQSSGIDVGNNDQSQQTTTNRAEKERDASLTDSPKGKSADEVNAFPATVSPSAELAVRPKSSGSTSIAPNTQQTPAASSSSPQAPEAEATQKLPEKATAPGPTDTSTQMAESPHPETKSPPPHALTQQPSAIESRQASSTLTSAAPTQHDSPAQPNQSPKDSSEDREAEIVISANKATASEPSDDVQSAAIKEEPSTSEAAGSIPAAVIEATDQQNSAPILASSPTQSMPVGAPQPDTKPRELNTKEADSRKQEDTSHAQPQSPPPPPVIATRNLISIVNLDLTSSGAATIPQELQGSLLLASSKPVKATKRSAKAPPPPVCAVTGLPIKYRDPRTGIGYANAYAYRQLRAIQSGRLRWNLLTGTYLGGPVRAADGVPDGFLNAATKSAASGAASAPPSSTRTGEAATTVSTT